MLITPQISFVGFDGQLRPYGLLIPMMREQGLFLKRRRKKKRISRSVVPDSLYPPGSLVSGILQARILGGLPCPSPEDLPDPGMESGSPALQADSLPLIHLGSPQKESRCKRSHGSIPKPWSLHGESPVGTCWRLYMALFTDHFSSTESAQS